jgi:hypothetical protein
MELQFVITVGEMITTLLAESGGGGPPLRHPGHEDAIRGDSIGSNVTSPAVIRPRPNPLCRQGRPLRCESPAFRDVPPPDASSGRPH